MDSEWAAARRTVGMELNHDLTSPSLDTQLQNQNLPSSLWDEQQPSGVHSEWPANTGPNLQPYHLPPQSLWAPEMVRLKAMRRRHTWKKLALQELSTSLLIHNLIALVNVQRFSRTAFSDPNSILSSQLQDVAMMAQPQAELARKDLLSNIELLHNMDADSAADNVVIATRHPDQLAVPSYHQDADGDFHIICQQMNRSINQLLQKVSTANDREEAQVILKICHNLLVSTASPDIHTFNALISGFRRWRRPRYVDAVIAAFYVHKLRPDEITCREIMGHYVVARRPDDFSRFVAKMRGVDDALMLADSKITVNAASHGRLIRVRKNKLYQKVHPTPMVFSALILGVLKFAGFDRALDIYYELKADGWGLDVQGLTTLLADCIRRSDWEGGTYLWEEIDNIKTKASSNDMAKAYYHMLSLCSITRNTVAFNQILSDVARRGLDRRSIMHAATVQTRRLRKASEYLAPAWTADNVLIAASDFIKGSQPNTADAVVNADYDDMNSRNDPTVDGESEEEEEYMNEDIVEETTSTAKDAWTSWVEHEFGIKPKDPES